MSKLFDQLKNAARSREEAPSSGLLIDALQRQQRPLPASGEATAAVPAPEAPEPTVPPATAPTPAPHRAASYSGLALAALIFAVAVFAWHSAPFRVPHKPRIDPSGLKLDRSLDLDRTTPKGTSPPGRPS